MAAGSEEGSCQKSFLGRPLGLPGKRSEPLEAITGKNFLIATADPVILHSRLE